MEDKEKLGPHTGREGRRSCAVVFLLRQSANDTEISLFFFLFWRSLFGDGANCFMSRNCCIPVSCD